MNCLHSDTIDGDVNKVSLSSDQDYDEAGMEVVEEAVEDASISVLREGEELTKKDRHYDLVPNDSSLDQPRHSTATAATNFVALGRSLRTAADRYPPVEEVDCYHSSLSPKRPSGIVAFVLRDGSYYLARRRGCTRRSHLEFDCCRLRTKCRD